MSIEDITKIIETINQDIQQIGVMISDYNSCNSDISKKYLLAAINKHAAKYISSEATNTSI